jgi:hypothetical protein
MASYTDIIPQFNPYIQQLPVEAMVRVGMQKQAQYEAGVQKIQSYIDNVAGLDIANSAQKEYLQSKLNQLGNDLRIVAGADFSNFQLVNSVGGMVNQVGKDPVVQNAVNSTAKLKKELSLMDQYRKSGKSDKNNEAYFNEKFASPYLAGGVDASFNGSFSPYVDIMEEVRKNVKDAGLDTSLIQQMYQTDTQGRVLYDKKTGQPIPARTMTEVETKTNVKQVKSIVENVLRRGDVQNQLSIDGWANTRNLPAETILSAYNQQYDRNVSDVDADILEINTLLTGKITNEERLKLQEQLKDLENTRTKYKSQYTDLQTLAKSNPELFKENYYKVTYENDLLNQFVKYEKTVKNVKSPLTEQLNWEADYAFKERQEAFDQSIALRQQLREDYKFQAEYEFDAATGKWSKKPEPTTKKPGEGGEPVRLTSDVPGKESMDAVQRNESQIRAIEQTNYSQGLDLMYDYLYKLNNGLDKDGNPLTKVAVKNNVEKWAKSNNETTSQFLTRWMLNLDNKAKENGVKLSHSDRQALGEFKRNHYNYTTMLAIDKIANDETFAATGINVQDYTKYLNPVNVKMKDGRSMTVTQQDVLDYMLVLKNDDKGAEDRLATKFGSFKDFPLNTYKSGYLTDEEFKNRQQLQKLSGMTNIYAKDFTVFQKAAKMKNDILAKYVTTDDVFSYGEDDEKGMKAAKNRVKGFIANAGSLSGKNYDKANALTALADANSTISFRASAPFEEGGQWKGTIVIATDKGQVIEVDVPVQSDLEQLSGATFNPYKFNPLRARASVSKFKSTNLGAFTTDERAWQTAAIGSENLISLSNSKKYIPLGADLNVMPGGGYTVTAYVKDRTTGQILRPIEFDRIYTSETQAQADLAMLTESLVDKELK